jgi:Bacterial regulatory proteins, gntR family
MVIGVAEEFPADKRKGRIAFRMQISLSKNSDVPLRQQLAEQIVFLITTGQLRAGEELPSVRALARRVKVHHQLRRVFLLKVNTLRLSTLRLSQMFSIICRV